MEFTILRYINITLESFSIIICLVLLAYQLLLKKKDKPDRWLTTLIVSNIFMVIGDVVERGFGGVPGTLVHHLLYLFSITLYFIASGVMLLSLLGWILSYARQKGVISKWWMRIGVILTVAQGILTITMPFHKASYISEQNYYVRGNYFLLTQISPYIIYFMAIIALIRYFKTFKAKERFFIGCFVFIPLVAEVIQVINSQLLLMNVAVTVGLIALLTFIQSQREFDKEEKIKSLVIGENEKLEDMRIRQENLNSQLIDVLCGAVEAKDIYTRGHSLRVAQYAREIMYRLGGDEQAQQEVYCIGILHDVGKISVKDEIINKKGRLTDEEYEQIKLHTVAGYQILRGVDIIPDLAIGARWHHERYDGTGYPNGLSGENIPLVARIISVADAYDAMTSNRSYHSVMPQSQVREQIEKGMGTQFDPKIAKIMLEMIDEDLQYEMKQVNFTRITNILMIDDDTFVHRMVDQILGDESYVITFASSGEEGIELMKENKYDLCLLDMEMPGMNGFETLEWIHNNIRKMKVIFLTGDKEIEVIKKSEELGAVDYLTKPINARILKESINSVLTH